MDYSRFVILLARQRSGTNALRSVLETHPDIYCLNEVFSIIDRTSEHEETRKSNFFNFLIEYANGDVAKILPDQHEVLFQSFFEYLSTFSTKRYIFVDVKYNTTHLLTTPYKYGDHPYLFDLIRKYHLRVLNVTRKNLLRYAVSLVKADTSGKWQVRGEADEYKDQQIYLDVEYLMQRIRICDSEDCMIRDSLSDYRRFYSWDYQDIFHDPSGGVGDQFLQGVSKWLGIKNKYAAQPTYRKQSSLPLEKTIQNYDEVASALKDAECEHLLEDEPSYVLDGNDAQMRLNSTDAELERVADRLFASRPRWVKGSLGLHDTRYLLRKAYHAAAPVVIEIGTASGFSTAVLCEALDIARKDGVVSPECRVYSYDLSTTFFADHSKRVGDAAREMLSEELLKRVEFRNPLRAADLKKFHGANEVGLLFIDANHNHPWPTLDLLAALPFLAPNATVIFHDINLPLIHQEAPGWGVKYLFDDLDVEKDVSVDPRLPNIGSFVVSDDRQSLETKLRQILGAHEWQAKIGDHYLRRLGVTGRTVAGIVDE